MTTPVVTFTQIDLPVNQPMSLGSIKARLGVLDFSTYATGGKIIDNTVIPCSQVLAIIPMNVKTDIAAAFPQFTPDATTGALATTLKVYTTTAYSSEFADGADAGEMLVLALVI